MGENQTPNHGVQVEEGCVCWGSEKFSPLAPGVFDVVMIVGALRDGFVPFSVVRELCLAAAPGTQLCPLKL